MLLVVNGRAGRRPVRIDRSSAALVRPNENKRVTSNKSFAMDLACADRHPIAVKNSFGFCGRTPGPKARHPQFVANCVADCRAKIHRKFAKQRAKSIGKLFGSKCQVMVAAVVSLGPGITNAGRAEIVYCFFDVLFHNSVECSP